jgi:hypothetical protein
MSLKAGSKLQHDKPTGKDSFFPVGFVLYREMILTCSLFIAYIVCFTIENCFVFCIGKKKILLSERNVQGTLSYRQYLRLSMVTPFSFLKNLRPLVKYSMVKIIRIKQKNVTFCITANKPQSPAPYRYKVK